MMNGANMIFVPMGDHDPAYLLSSLTQVLDIGDNVIDPQHVVFGKHKTGINDEDFPTVLVHHHIPSNFPQTSQGYNSQFVLLHFPNFLNFLKNNYNYY